MADESTVERRIFVILEELLPESSVANLNTDDSLISSGILDSLTLLRLVTMLEEQFGMTVHDGELLPDNFESIARIKMFLAKKSSDETANPKG